MKGFRIALFLFALPALVAAGAPEVFIYDRAAILSGEWWRLWTGHWVHFSASHAACNLGPLVLATVWLESVRPGWTVRLVGVSAPSLGLGLLALAPEMHAYGGLSGLLAGVVILLALVQITSIQRGRYWWFCALGLIAGKIVWESAASATLFSRLEPELYRPSAAAHVLGGLIALGCFLAAQRRPAAMARANTDTGALQKSGLT